MYKYLQKTVDWLDRTDFVTRCAVIALIAIVFFAAISFSTHDWDNFKPTSEDYEHLQLAADYLVGHNKFCNLDSEPAFENVSSYDISCDDSGLTISLAHKDSDARLQLVFNNDMKLQTKEQLSDMGGTILATIFASLAFGILVGIAGGFIVTIIHIILDTILEHIKKKNKHEEEG